MHFKSCILTLLGATLVNAAIDVCGTPEPTEEQEQLDRRLHAVEADATRNFALPEEIDIDVYFHVIFNNNNLSEDHFFIDQLSRQLTVLNDAFEPYNVKFNLSGTDHIATPPNWRGGCNREELNLLRARWRKGTYADLNVYFLPEILCISTSSGVQSVPFGQKVTGYVYEFPTEVEPGSNREKYDSVNVLTDTIPGGNFEGRNRGTTMIHEVGHWLGLFHTFHGGCEGRGDHVDDTAAEDFDTAQEHSGECDYSRDSCPRKPGKDPVDNFMNYSSEVRFTPGQAKRIFTWWTVLRAPHQKPARKMRGGMKSTMPTLNATTPALDSTTPELGSTLSRTERSVGK